MVHSKEININKILSNYIKVYKIILSIDKIFVFFTFFSAFVFGITPLISLKLMQLIINSIQTLSDNLQHIFVFLVFYILVNILSSVFNLYSQYYTALFQFKLNKYIDIKILERSSNLDLHDFESTNSYNLIKRAQSSNRIYAYFSYSISLIQTLVTLLSYIYIFITWRWWCIIPVLISSLTITLINNVINIRKYNMIRQRTTDERKKNYYHSLLTNDIAFKEIKVYNLSQFFIKKFSTLYDKIMNQDKSLLKYSNKYNIVSILIEEFISAFIFILIICDILYHRILFGDLITYINTTNNTKTSINTFLSILTSIVNDNLYINQIFEFIELSDQNYDEQTPPLLHLSNIQTIEIKNLSYHYLNNSQNIALKNINIGIKQGDIIAIIGQNGSGKSTLIKILCGLYNNYSGNIYINGINMKQIDKNSYFSNISVLFQDYTKYEASLRENIAISNIKDMSNTSKIVYILKNNNFQKFLKSIDQQLGFWFDNGTQLSGGEWMKVGISRALFRDASVFIFDEPNASLDSFSEQQIFQQIKVYSKGKISLIVTHRLSSILLYATKIAVMKDGELIAFDSHENLINSCEYYKKIYNSSL